MGTVIVRPDADFAIHYPYPANPTGTQVVGAGSMAAALSDDNDASYVHSPNFAGFDWMFIVGFANPTIPPGGVVDSVTVRARVRGTQGIGMAAQFATGTEPLFSEPVSLIVRNPGMHAIDGFVTYGPGEAHGAVAGGSGGASAALSSVVPPGNGWYVGGPWSQGDLNQLAIAFYVYENNDDSDPGFGGGDVDISEAFVDIHYVLPPTVTVNTPSGAITSESNPLVGWTFNRAAESPSDQDSFQVRLFTAAQYGIGGFDPATSPATFDSGVVNSGDRSLRLPILTNGTYRVYVRVGSITNQQTQWSTWASSDFVLTVPGPGAPTLSIVCQDDEGRVQITVGMGAAPTWEFVEVQRSIDGGLTWTDMRASTVTAPGVPPTPPTPPTGGADDLYEPDNPQAWIDAFGPDLGFDQEFDRAITATALPTGWVFQNQSSASYVEQLGRGKVIVPSGNNNINDVTAIVRPVAGFPSTWIATGKASTHYSTINPKGVSSGLILTDGTKGVGILWNVNPFVLVSRWNDINGNYNNNPATAAVPATEANIPYWQIEKNTVNDYDFRYSYDGELWVELGTAIDVGAFMTPTHIGFLFNQLSGVQEMFMDWFRLR